MLSVALKHRRLDLIKTVVRCAASGTYNQSFLNGTSSTYIESMFDRWQDNPGSVHPSWDAYFRAETSGLPPSEQYKSPFAFNIPMTMPKGSYPASTATVVRPSTGKAIDHAVLEDHLAVQLMIRYYQLKGHSIANLDPLEMSSADLDDSIPPELLISHYGFSEKDLNREFNILDKSTFIGTRDNRDSLPLKDILSRLKDAYCGTIGTEFMYMRDKAQIDWIKEKLENPVPLEIDERRLNMSRLIRSTQFEKFLAKKWSSEKRFGLEGCEVLVPCIKTVIDNSCASSVESFVIGMPHRGRLNVLANVARKELAAILCQFDSSLETTDSGSGDVKYHLGICTIKTNHKTGKQIKMSVVANPSHLEAVDPVVQGKVRAEQFYSGDTQGDKTMSILIHGDASFSGQGVVYETFHLSDLNNYNTHGTIHIVANNQIGFTTDPRHSRSSPYCTDVAHVVNAPIFHVNGDDPDAVLRVSKIAADYRAKFKKDVVIDIVCYRRYGHNEMDEPMFTQPIMYSKVASHPIVMNQYAKQLQKEGVISQEDFAEEKKRYEAICEQAYDDAKKIPAITNSEWLDSPWEGFFENRDPMMLPVTGVTEDVLQHIGGVFSADPNDFNLHRGVARILRDRATMVAARKADWALGEALAWGSLLLEGTHVRLSGQDVERGTFSHRHHVLHDQKVDMKVYNPLNHLSDTQAHYTVCNSSLSEYAVLGFELGFSLEKPNSLIMWEAQFGDFANTAQCIIDQFISCGQQKWVRQSGLVLLLPHGHEGMGPEHSSARPERFLQLCNDDSDILPKINSDLEMQQLHETNWIVANPSTPANYFHLMRRQVLLPFRKPLVIFSPKYLLRHPEARSSFDDFHPSKSLRRVIPEEGVAAENPSAVRKLIICSGKVYFEIKKQRDDRNLSEEIAICRVEQISPFPYDLIADECDKYSNANVVFCQEEHKNQGFWSYMQPRLNTVLKHKCNRVDGVKYVGRPPSAAAATGSKHSHAMEVSTLFSNALDL